MKNLIQIEESYSGILYILIYMLHILLIILLLIPPSMKSNEYFETKQFQPVCINVSTSTMISSPMDIICKKHEKSSWSDEVILQILVVEFATIAKKCNHHKDDADKKFIKQSILDHAPTRVFIHACWQQLRHQVIPMLIWRQFIDC